MGERGTSSGGIRGKERVGERKKGESGRVRKKGVGGRGGQRRGWERWEERKVWNRGKRSQREGREEWERTGRREKNIRMKESEGKEWVGERAKRWAGEGLGERKEEEEK